MPRFLFRRSKSGTSPPAKQGENNEKYPLETSKYWIRECGVTGGVAHELCERRGVPATSERVSIGSGPMVLGRSRPRIGAFI
jgi:hypothetical protein